MNYVLDALIADLDSIDPSVRVESMYRLKSFGQHALAACPALRKIMADSSDPFLQLLAAGILGLIDPSDRSATPVLVSGLQDSVSLHRAISIDFLGERKNKQVVLRAMTLLSDEEFIVRFAAGKAIGKVVGDFFHAAAVCVAMLKDDNPTNRAMGAAALLSVRHLVKDHLDLLVMAMADTSWEARLDIEDILHQLQNN